MQALYFRDMGWPLTHLGLVLAGGFLLRMLTQYTQVPLVAYDFTTCWREFKFGLVFGVGFGVGVMKFFFQKMLFNGEVNTNKSIDR